MSVPTPLRPVQAALVGAGMIAKTHVSAISDAQDRVQLKTILSRRPDRATYLADHYDGPAPQFTSDLGDILDDSAIDMVIVATPPKVRIDLITALAKAGKHILLEKPIARTLAEAKQVVEICEAAGISLGLLFQHRAQEASVSAAAHIARGDFGALGHVDISVPLWRDQSYYDELGRGTYERDGGGVLLTQAIHTIDLALSLTGPVTAVQAMTATTPLHQMEAEDFAVAGLRFASGAVGSLTANTASFLRSPETISMHFENASLRLERFALKLAWRDGRTETEDHGASGTEDGSAVLSNHLYHQRMIEDFVTAITTKGAPMVTGQQALVSHALIDAIERSSQSGVRIDLP